MSYLTDDLASRLGSDLVGAVRTAKRLATPEAAGQDAVVVLFKATQLEPLPVAAVLIVPKGVAPAAPHIAVQDPRLALAQLSSLFDQRSAVAEGIHPSAVIHPQAQLAENVHVAANAVVAADVRVGAGTRIGANCSVAEGVVIGENCILHPQVTLYEATELQARVVLHSGVVIGGDGFGYAASPRGALKLHHLGGVVLQDDVEIGANSCVDRGTLGTTVIGARSKIDNLCQIGHNVTIGTDCLIAGTSAVAGSTTLGDRVMVGGGVGMVDHIHVGNDVKITARSLLTKNVPDGETWAGNPAQPYKTYARERYLLGKLESLWQSLKDKL